MGAQFSFAAKTEAESPCQYGKNIKWTLLFVLLFSIGHFWSKVNLDDFVPSDSACNLMADLLMGRRRPFLFASVSTRLARPCSLPMLKKKAKPTVNA